MAKVNNTFINIENIDCLEGLKKISDKSVQLVITSPPYNMDDERYYKKYEDNKISKEYISWLLKINKEVYRILKDNGVYCLNINYNRNSPHQNLKVATDCVEKIGFLLNEDICWSRKGFPITEKRNYTRDWEHIFLLTKSKDYLFNTPYNNKSNVWFMDNHNVQVINSQYSKTKLNSATFPLEFPYRCIESFTKENDLVVDVFSGMGTTAVASKILKRNFIGFEYDIEQCNASLNRLDKCVKVNETWILSDKTKDKFDKLKSEIKIYQYQDDIISYHENLWYLNKDKSKPNKFANTGIGYVGICKKEDIKVFYHDGAKLFIPREKVKIIEENRFE